MKKVARRVALSLSEAKRFTVLNDNVFTNFVVQRYQWRYKNIFAQLPTASGTFAGASSSVVGNEIVDLLWKAKFSCNINYNDILQQTTNIYSYGTIYYHVMIVAANDYAGTVVGGAPPPGTLTWTTLPAQFSSDDPGWFLQENALRPTLNGNNVKLIRRWTKKFTPDVQYQRFAVGDNLQIGLGKVQFNMTCKHRFKGKKTFEDNPNGDLDANYPRSGALRGWNYYVLCGWSSPTVIDASNAQPQMVGDQFLYFKDP